MLGNAGSDSESRCFTSMLSVRFCKLDEKERVRGDARLNSVGSGEGRAGGLASSRGALWTKASHGMPPLPRDLQSFYGQNQHF